MMPDGTAHTTMSRIAYRGAPRLVIRLSPIQAATTMPSTMNRAYARSGIGPRCHTEVLGLGMLAKVTADTLPPPVVCRQPGHTACPVLGFRHEPANQRRSGGYHRPGRARTALPAEPGSPPVVSSGWEDPRPRIAAARGRARHPGGDRRAG